MNHSIQRFTLDLHLTQSQVSLPVTMGDTARVWQITLSDGSLPYRIADGVLAKLEIRRPTGTHIEEFCPIEKNTAVRYAFSQNENTAAVGGIHECALVLYDGDGSRIASPRFTMVVSERVVSDDELNLSDTDRSAVEAMLAAEASREAAEAGRVNTEASRQTQEEARAASEETRAAAETERIAAEAERAEAEAARAEAETARAKRFLELFGDSNESLHSLFSPTVSVEEIEGGHRITVKDYKQTNVFDVMNGTDGADGKDGETGKSAYAYAHENGYEGTEEAFGRQMALLAAVGIYDGETEAIA